MSSKKYCKYCLEVDPTAVRSWNIGHHSLEIPGCKSCHARHEKQVTDLQAELTHLRAAFAMRKADHEIELSRKEAESSLALTLKDASCRRLQLQVDKLEAGARDQRRKVKFLQLDRDFIVPQRIMLWNEELRFYPLIDKSEVVQNLLIEKSLPARKCIMEMNDGPSFQISIPVFEGVIDFCHSGELTFSELVSPEEVLRAAHLLRIEFLQEFCEEVLCDKLSVDNVPEMLKLARMYAATKLQKEAEKIFKEHFDVLNTKMYEVWERTETTVSVPDSDAGVPISVPYSPFRFQTLMQESPLSVPECSGVGNTGQD
ncbi:unnamed protein product [Calypogeia fissa]